MALYHTYNDAELIARLQQGDEAAFTEIFSRYWENMLAIAYRLTGDKSAAKEIVQELFTGVWQRRYELTISHLEAYLTTAIKFSFFKRVERERRRKQLEQYAVSQNIIDEASLDREVEALFLRQYIQGLIEQLPEKCRLVFQLSRVEQLSNAEIADRLQISEKTVEGHLTKGIKVLRIQLQDSGLAIVAATAMREIFF